MLSTFRNFAQAQQDSRIPKYKQLVKVLLIDIEKNNLQIGAKLPSINEASEDCYLSRDTVERAYAELHRLGVITSIFRMGYFISGKSAKTKTKIFFLVGKITENNKIIFNALVDYVGKDVTVDIFTYNYKSENFREIINANLGNYHYYVVVPHSIEETEENLKCLKKIKGERLIFLDQTMPTLAEVNSGILCDYRKEICRVMQQNIKFFEKYKTLNLILTENEYFDELYYA